MDRARIAELLRPFLVAEERVGATGSAPGLAAFARPGFARPRRPDADLTASLTQSQLQNISIYIDLLLRWNARVNLTAVRDPEEIVTRHFGESLFAARQLFPENRVESFKRTPFESQVPNDQRPRTNDLIDIGSGAGFPGLPIKIWAPQLQVTLIESNRKKATFLREVIRALTLMNVDVSSARAESFQKGSEGFPKQAAVVTLRAVERFDAVLPTAARLVAPAGRLAILISLAQSTRAHQLLPSFRWERPVPVPLSESRILLVGHNLVKNIQD
jgi:16S rRNA (guanine527-N7)-methyltransferase